MTLISTTLPRQDVQERYDQTNDIDDEEFKSNENELGGERCNGEFGPYG